MRLNKSNASLINLSVMVHAVASSQLFVFIFLNFSFYFELGVGGEYFKILDDLLNK